LDEGFRGFVTPPPTPDVADGRVAPLGAGDPGAAPAEASNLGPVSGRGVWSVPLWVGAGLLFWLLGYLTNTEPRSRLWGAELVLFALLLVGLWANAKHDLRKRLRIPRRLAPVAYVGLVWLFGMTYEASLTVTGTGIGGVHPGTLPSFLLAQGDYIPIALVSLFVIRRTRASFREIYFFAGGKSLTEGLVFMGVLSAVLVSPTFWLAPLVLAYYTLAYATFMALPLLFVDEALLWKGGPAPRPRSIPFYWLLGFVLALAIRIFWGLVYSPVATSLFQLPPNP
jgi:hypothetical protein